MGPFRIQPSILFILFSSLLQAQWIHLTGGPQDDIISDLFCHEEILYAAASYSGLFTSTDKGTSWIPADSSITAVNAFAGGNGFVFAGCQSGVFRSNDGGLNWIQVNTGLTDTGINSLTFSGNDLYAGTCSGVFKSSDNGSTWNPLNNGLLHTWIISLAADPQYVFAGTNGGGVYVLNNDGTEWLQVNSGLCELIINSIIVTDHFVFSGTSGHGIFRSLKQSINWTQINSGLSDTNISAIINMGTNLAACTHGGIFKSADNGASWTDISQGLPANCVVLSAAHDEEFIYAGLYYGGIWSRNLSEILTSADDIEVPGNFILFQNYPNPFNPSTSIRYSVSSAAEVCIKIFDILGKEIALLINHEQPAGTYEIKWDASGMPSGFYFCQLKAGKFTETKKMMFTK